MLTQVEKTQKASEKTDSLFTKKWQEIEKKQKRNANVQKKIDTLYQFFQDNILPEEQEVSALLAQETQHLISFLPKKSFTQWQREELQSWIENNLSTLSQHPFVDRTLFDKVSQEYNDFLVGYAKKINKDHDFEPEEIDYMCSMADEMFNGEKEFTDEELRTFMRDPSIFQQTLREFLAKKAQEKEDIDFDEDEFFQEQKEEEFYSNGSQRYQDQQRAKKQEKLKSLFNSSKLNKFYKILANRLHPDKETNEHLKAEKSELMAKLVAAKKNKDAFTIITMFHQFMPNSEHILFEGDDTELTQALIGLLNEKLHQLDKENQENKCDDGMKSMVWQRFSGRSKKAQQENIDIHMADLEDDKIRFNYYIQEVKTVKLLKEILSERYDERNENMFTQGDFSLDDLADLFR